MSRIDEIRQRLERWRENCAVEGGDPDHVAIFEAHAADDIAWLLPDEGHGSAAEAMFEDVLHALDESSTCAHSDAVDLWCFWNTPERPCDACAYLKRRIVDATEGLLARVALGAPR